MFDKLFSMIRRNIKVAILGGIADAQEELDGRIDNHEPLLIEVDEEPKSGNGKPRRKAVAK